MKILSAYYILFIFTAAPPVVAEFSLNTQSKPSAWGGQLHSNGKRKMVAIHTRADEVAAMLVGLIYHP